MGTLKTNTVEKANGDPVDLSGMKAAKVTCSYNQQTPAVIRSFNVSSVTDNSAGNYSVNFTNDFDAADMVMAGMPEGSSNTAYGRSIEYFSQATGSVTFKTTDGYSSTHSAVDRASSGSLIMGDLA